jgi:hypothetical protein
VLAILLLVAHGFLHRDQGLASLHVEVLLCSDRIGAASPPDLQRQQIIFDNIHINLLKKNLGRE